MSKNNLFAPLLLIGSIGLMAGMFKKQTSSGGGTPNTPQPITPPNDTTPPDPTTPPPPSNPYQPFEGFRLPTPFGGIIGDDTPPLPQPDQDSKKFYTLLERRAAESKINTDPTIRYCPRCFTRFFQGYIYDGDGGWYNYNVHVAAHDLPDDAPLKKQVWSEACPFDDIWFYEIEEFKSHLLYAHNYSVVL